MTVPENVDWPDVIRKVKRANLWSFKTLASKLGVGRSAVEHWARGVNVPKYAKAAALLNMKGARPVVSVVPEFDYMRVVAERDELLEVLRFGDTKKVEAILARYQEAS